MTMRPSAVLAALALVAAPMGARAQLMNQENAVPPGFGTLRQDDIQMTLRTPMVELRFLPLDQRTGNLLSPDAYRSFRKLLLDNRARIDSVAKSRGISQPGIAFVSFFGLAPGAFYDAEVVAIVVRNRLLRPIGIVPYTPGFMEQRLEPRDLRSAFYLYEETIPVLEPFSVEYQNNYRVDWEGKISRINAERQRAALRAAKTGAQDTLRPAGAR